MSFNVGDRVTMNQETLDWYLTEESLDFYTRPSGNTADDVQKIKDMLYAVSMLKHKPNEFAVITDKLISGNYAIQYNNFKTIVDPCNLVLVEKKFDIYDGLYKIQDAAQSHALNEEQVKSILKIIEG